jgi:hypothetical protein
VPRLYHFTKAVHLKAIQRDGITRHWVPRVNGGGVWLTDDGRWYKQAWNAPNEVVGAVPIAYRLAIDFADDDPHLERWPELAKRLLVPQAKFDALHTSGGRSSHRWWIYLDDIPAERIVETEARAGGVPQAEHDLGAVVYGCPTCFRGTEEGVFPTIEEFRQHFTQHPGAQVGEDEPLQLIEKKKDH